MKRYRGFTNADLAARREAMTKKSKKVVAPLPSYLPRAKQLSRELLPAAGVTSLRESVLKHLPEFRVVNEYLPSLSFMLEYNRNLKSPVESFEVVGTPDGYLLDIRAKLQGEEEPKHLELFAGIGGFRRAIDLFCKDQKIESKCVGFSEIDKYAIKVAQKNYPNTIELGDINNWKDWNLQHIDLCAVGVCHRGAGEPRA